MSKRQRNKIGKLYCLSVYHLLAVTAIKGTRVAFRLTYDSIEDIIFRVSIFTMHFQDFMMHGIDP